jgi:uncharacterized peroxidase-related enzyme
MTVRLDVLDHGHGARNRLALRLMGALAGAEPDAVVKTALYRPRFFGRPWIFLIRSIMRGRSPWTAGERELFGALISRLNTCRYCLGVHSSGATLTLGRPITVDQLDRWRDAAEADFSPRVRAAFALLETLTLAPATVTLADIEAVRAAGVSEAGVVDLLYLVFLFNAVNRMANALDYAWDTEATARKIAAILNRTGYRLPGFLLR